MRGIVLFMAGCTTYIEPPAERGHSLRVIDEGTPEAAGVLAMVNDPSTTLTVLDEQVPLERRAAENIIAHRDGPDGPFDTIAKLDGVSRVGDAALEALLDYAVANGWVNVDIAGTWDGETFTHAEVALILEVANDETEIHLDFKARLDSRAVDSILAARPIDMDELASLYWVGGSALESLLFWATVRENACPYAENFWDLYYGSWQGYSVLGTWEFCTDSLADGTCPDPVTAETEFRNAVGPHHSPWCGYSSDITCGPDPSYPDDCCYTATLSEWCE